MKRNTELAVLYVGSKNNCIFFEVFDKTDGMRSLGTVKQYPSRIDFLLSDQLKPDVLRKMSILERQNRDILRSNFKKFHDKKLFINQIDISFRRSKLIRNELKLSLESVL
ncbi:hypothetical protein ACPF3S_003199 [Vibrio cholerae]|uniref:Uncharacterized protein n=1 Tax=Vibrio cholerae TaxID=666 RepID=A0A7Z7VMP2_VIBCL|nr:hypothetical protein [Vibrio cholerae]EGR5063498.1 hypothetical protein [Vibrio cholerae]EKF9501105.1 hypothetical protein [Vibrio cholerae]ELH0870632.1 hypothetical protein [Vibrio cholerae]EMA3788874.1 hypothetical protein [Vibrio cholerae]TBM41310.1 hypothetical protein EYB64_12105 [Vibrio cholerae]